MQKHNPMAHEKILIVEENPMNRELTEALLTIAGYRVIQASTVEEGVKLAKSEVPDMILMNIGLSRTEGFEAVKFLRKDEPTKHIPVIALTSHAMTRDEEEVLRNGCAGYITKPINTRTFTGTIADYLSKTKGNQP